MGPTTDPQLLTIDEAAERLRTTRMLLLRKCRAGEIRATKPFGTWLIPADAIDEVLAEGFKAQQRRQGEGVA